MLGWYSGQHTNASQVPCIAVEPLSLAIIFYLPDPVMSKCNRIVRPEYLGVVITERNFWNPEVYSMLFMAAIGLLVNYLSAEDCLSSS